MADLADIDHFYGGDIGVTPSGDIAVVTKGDLTIQRIIRRLLTSPTDSRGSAYPWIPDYGVGLGSRIGEALDISGIQADVCAQMRREPTVQRIPAPTVNVTDNGNGATIDVAYTDNSGTPKSFSFDLTP